MVQAIDELAADPQTVTDAEIIVPWANPVGSGVCDDHCFAVTADNPPPEPLTVDEWAPFGALFEQAFTDVWRLATAIRWCGVPPTSTSRSSRGNSSARPMRARRADVYSKRSGRTKTESPMTRGNTSRSPVSCRTQRANEASPNITTPAGSVAARDASVTATTMTSASDSNAIQPTVVIGASGVSRPPVRVLARAIQATDTITGTTITTELSPADGERARAHSPRDPVSAD